MDYILCFDYVAFVIYILMIIKSIYCRTIRIKTERIFLIIATLCAFSVIADIASVSTSLGRNMVLFANTTYIILRCIAGFFYFIYINCITDTICMIFKSRKKCILWTMPMIIVFGLCILNLFNECLFSVDNLGYYHRGQWLTILYLTNSFYMVAAAVSMFKNRTVLSFEKVILGIAFVPLAICSLIIQGVYPQLLVEMIFTAFALLLVSIAMDRLEDQIDQATGIIKKEHYFESVQRSYYVKRDFTVLLIHINNYTTIKRVGGSEATARANQIMVRLMAAINRENRLTSEQAYLRNGAYAVVFTNKERIQARRFAEQLIMGAERLKNEYNMQFSPIVNACIVQCPEDISSSKVLVEFSENFSKIIDFDANPIVELSEVNSRMNTHLLLEIDDVIDRALRNQSFEVYYQPIFDTKSDKFRSAEALLRLRDEKYGLVSPALFIPAAEESGAIIPIGDFVFESVCKFVVSEQYKKLGLEYIEVNLSITQCMEPTLADRMIEIMKFYHVPACMINIEITESAISYDEEVLTQNINKLKAYGVSLSLDDYGTGYSNIRRMAKVPFDIVKLDKIFVEERNDPKMKVIIEDTIRMVKNLNLSVLVEGIEEKSDLDFFTSLGCDYIQGYYYSKPVPVDEFISFLDSKSDEVAVS